mgnify:CR=1 FL=1
MVNKCDICGFTVEPDARFCGGCNVDLRETKGSDTLNATEEKKEAGKKKTKASSKNETSENENVIKWCVIQGWCN